MKAFLVLVLVVVLFPALAGGERIYGTIKLGEMSIGSGKLVEISTMNGTFVCSDTTDRYGAYRLFVRERGNLYLKLYYPEGQTPSIQIYSYESSPVRYDLILYRDQNGNYQLRRQ